MSPLQLYKCLADDTRLRCILLIAHEQELCVCELMSALGENQPKVSRHLAQLRKDGLLQDRRQGQWVYYRLSPELAPWMRQVIAETLAHNPDYLADSLTQLAAMGDRLQRSR
ncbi:metalloregulator ArsR/SmtB family transcription factor [Zobellella aerophila]|uniref:Metalloregulator ArsR/SmtB family transcription factor n=1 Tax=Zobellella aerophila TaxID=870480 RepID=A0ABP6V4B6_9GAMM